ncbi:hypothetical protein [Acidisphaera sp. S103]|uniref:hypothetical protein n=1 Tax=Acidisphaera sp. S103 TaxID=1747223 RepID=UPI0015768A9C|nr:hypothetical protein [Acidisphaera sp. S103]
MKIEVGPNQRRTPKRCKNATRLGRFPSDRLAHEGAQPRRLRPILSQPSREGPDKVAISIAPEHFKPGKATFAEARAIVLDSALL